MSSYLFSVDLSMNFQNFSKTINTIFIKFSTAIVHPEVHLRSQWHQNHDWDLRNSQNVVEKS